MLQIRVLRTEEIRNVRPAFKKTINKSLKPFKRLI